jgi:predicted component of type VI protein secretion system
MAERTQVRREHWIDRTAVRAEGNNPFRWGQANRVAIDLLRDGGPGFLVGAAAVEASFSDLIQHQQSVSAATIESIAAVLRAFSPGAIEAGSRGRSMLEPKAAACWSGFLREHQKLRSLADEDPKSLLGKAFRSACEQSGSELASRQSA